MINLLHKLYYLLFSFILFSSIIKAEETPDYDREQNIKDQILDYVIDADLVTLQSSFGNDFILMDPIYHRLTSSIARKSNFIGKSDYNNFDINLINEAKKRRKISNKLENSILNFSEVNKDLLNEIKFYKPIIIIKQNFLKHFPESVNNNMIGTGEVLINFYEEEENKKFLINCINKIS